MFTVMGFTKFSGLFSLNGRVKPVLLSNLGQVTCFSIGVGSYCPGPTLILGSTAGSIPFTANLSAFETKPLPEPYVLNFFVVAWAVPLITESTVDDITEYDPGPGSLLKSSLKPYTGSKRFTVVPNDLAV